MPTYEYACTACGHRLEAVQSFSDDPLTECPECGGNLRKVYAPVGIVLKGSGFYKTDSRAAATGSSKKGTSSSEGSGAESGASSKESAPSGGDGAGAGAGSGSDKGKEKGQGSKKEAASASSSTS